MLKDITLGQYFPGNSIAHKLDPRTKILLVTLYIIARGFIRLRDCFEPVFKFCFRHILSLM